MDWQDAAELVVVHMDCSGTDFAGMDYSGKNPVDIHTSFVCCHGSPDHEESDSMDIGYMDSVLRILRRLVFHLILVYPGLVHLS